MKNKIEKNYKSGRNGDSMGDGHSIPSPPPHDPPMVGTESGLEPSPRILDLKQKPIPESRDNDWGDYYYEWVPWDGSVHTFCAQVCAATMGSGGTAGVCEEGSDYLPNYTWNDYYYLTDNWQNDNHYCLTQTFTNPSMSDIGQQGSGVAADSVVNSSNGVSINQWCMDKGFDGASNWTAGAPIPGNGFWCPARESSVGLRQTKSVPVLRQNKSLPVISYDDKDSDAKIKNSSQPKISNNKSMKDKSGNRVACSFDDIYWGQYPSFDIHLPQDCSSAGNIPCSYAGEYSKHYVYEGNTYTYSTCADADGNCGPPPQNACWDTQLILWDENNLSAGQYVAYNDDANCPSGGTGVQSNLVWTATYTGYAYLQIMQYYCQYNSSCATINISCVSGSGGEIEECTTGDPGWNVAPPVYPSVGEVECYWEHGNPDCPANHDHDILDGNYIIPDIMHPKCLPTIPIVYDLSGMYYGHSDGGGAQNWSEITTEEFFNEDPGWVASQGAYWQGMWTNQTCTSVTGQAGLQSQCCCRFEGPSSTDVYGCPDPSACNYNSDATYDDGSCIFPIGCVGPLVDDPCLYAEDSPDYGLDVCGVCGGSGIPEGDCDCGGLTDQGCGCGEAGPTGCDNTCGSDLVNDDCGVCGGSNEDIDDCGVCFGNNSDDLGCGCFEAGPSGCDNTCGSDLEFDECGVCGGSGPSGCDNTCGSDLELDDCGICGGNNATMDDCGECSNYDGYVYADQGCGCFEPGPSGCDNVCGSTLENDECGVCGGGGIPEGYCDCNGNVNLGCGCGASADCIDCNDVPNGGLEFDECGVCGGDGIAEGECDCNGNVLDCAGVCGGSSENIGCGCGEPGPSGCDNVCGSTLEFDECGVCGGPGIIEGTCDCDGNVLDCNDVCGGNAEIDECGICGGSGPNDCGDCNYIEVDLGCGCGSAAPSGCNDWCPGDDGEALEEDICGECGGNGLSCIEIDQNCGCTPQGPITYTTADVSGKCFQHFMNPLAFCCVYNPNTPNTDCLCTDTDENQNCPCGFDGVCKMGDPNHPDFGLPRMQMGPEVGHLSTLHAPLADDINKDGTGLCGNCSNSNLIADEYCKGIYHDGYISYEIGESLTGNVGIDNSGAWYSIATSTPRIINLQCYVDISNLEM